MFAVRPSPMHPGAERAKFLLNDVPNRFVSFCSMDQLTFVQLADWLTAHTQSMTPEEVSIEESLFVFLDVVAQGRSFAVVAEHWRHDVDMVKRIFLDILSALSVLHDTNGISPECPSLKSTRSKWRIMKTWQKSRKPGRVRVGEEVMGDDGLEISQEQLTRVLLTLNSWIFECSEW